MISHIHLGASTQPVSTQPASTQLAEVLKIELLPGLSRTLPRNTYFKKHLPMAASV